MKYLAYKDFRVADTAEPYFTLLYLPFSEQADVPHFKECAKTPSVELPGFVLYYTNGCPFTAKYVPLIEQWAAAKCVPFTVIKIEGVEEARKDLAKWTSVFSH